MKPVRFVHYNHCGENYYNDAYHNNRYCCDGFPTPAKRRYETLDMFPVRETVNSSGGNIRRVCQRRLIGPPHDALTNPPAHYPLQPLIVQVRETVDYKFRPLRTF